MPDAVGAGSAVAEAAGTAAIANPVDGGVPQGFEEAFALGLRAAPLGRRALAFGVEVAIVLVIAIPGVVGFVQMASDAALGRAPSLGSTILLLSSLVVGCGFEVTQVVLHGLKGVTVGKAIFGIRSINMQTLGKPGFWRMLLRALVLQVSLWVPPLVGAVVVLLSPLWDARKLGRGWLDVVGGNWLIDTANGLDPYDAKALRRARKGVESPAETAQSDLPSLATVYSGASIQPPAEFARGARLESAIVGAVHSSPPEPIRPEPSPSDPSPREPLPPEPSPRPATEAVLVFDDGTRIRVSGAGLIGRNPEAREGEAVGMLVSVADETWSISKTHAAFGFDARGFWILDRASRNGTSVRVGDELRTVSGQARMRVGWGQTVVLGDRTFVVRSAGQEESV